MAEYYFRDSDLTTKPKLEKHFSPLNCRMDAPVHSAEDQYEYIETNATCDTDLNYGGFFVRGWVVRDQKLLKIGYDDIVKTNTYENGAAISKIAVSKKKIQKENFLLKFKMEVVDGNESSPIISQDLTYEYPKTFNGEKPVIPEGVFVIYSPKYMHEEDIWVHEGNRKTLKCLAAGNPLPNVTMLRGTQELAGLKEDILFDYIKSKVSTSIRIAFSFIF